MFEMKIQVRYSETDPAGYARLYQILDYFQDAATFHSMSLGLDIGCSLMEGRAWYLLSWDVVLARYPKIGENITVITQPYKMKGFYGYRRFFIKDEDGNVMVSADSIWVLMDTDNKLPVRIPEELTRLFVAPGSDPTVRVKRKLAEKGDWEKKESIEVTDIFLDSNIHVNNAFYVQWAQMLVPRDKTVRRLRVDYRQSAFKGDILNMYQYMDQDICRVKFTGRDGILIAMADLYCDYDKEPDFVRES
ncbi:MAG: hypothetical protein IJI25_11140 [Eubacterium sp.]|nr:hypothetical protein [Eubacterium sp.]